MKSPFPQRPIPITKVSMCSAKRDTDYWCSQSYIQRLAVLEELRQTFIRWKYGAQSGFQRVYTVIER